MPDSDPTQPPAQPSDSHPAPACAAHWPGAVQWPGSPGFERSARAWLFDLAPPRCRYEDVLHRRTVELARLVRLRLEADIAAMRTGLRALIRQQPRTEGEYADRTDLAELYRREADWASNMLAQVKLVERCLIEGGGDDSAADLASHSSPADQDRITHISAPRRASGL